MYVSSGGTANSTTVNDGGSLIVSSGGTANEIIENGGYVDVVDGANAVFASNTISGLVLSDGSATIHSSTTANSTTVKYGSLIVSSGGTANSTTVNYRGSMYVSSGGIANSTTVNRDGNLIVSSGGMAVSTTVNSRGSMYVSSGGTANSATINVLGSMYVFSGGTANSTTVNDGGRLCVFSGGTANSTTVNSYGYLRVTSGGTANNTAVNSGGFATGVSLQNGDRLTISSGGTARDTTVNNGGLFTVKSGGTAMFTYVSSGGLVRDITLESGCDLTVFSGGTANSTTVNNGGRLYVSMGGTANSTTVNDGGRLYVSMGGTADNATVNSGGFAIGITVNPGASLTVESGGSAIELFVSSGGCIYISSGAITTVPRIQSGGSVVGIVFSSGFFSVGNGITVNGATVFRGSDLNSLTSAVLNVSRGGTADNAVISSGGTLILCSGGTANGAVINGSGRVNVSSGAIADGIVLNDGWLYVSSGGTATNVIWTPCNGGGFSFDGHITFASRYSGVYYGTAKELISHAQSMEGQTMDKSFQSMFVMSDGSIDSTTVSNFGVVNVIGGKADHTTVSGNRIQGSGVFNIASGGIADNTSIFFSGVVGVRRDGTANNTVVNQGGYLYVYSGGTATVVFNPWQGTVSSQKGADVSFLERDAAVYYGGGNSGLIDRANVMVSLIIENDRSAIVYSGGTAKDTTVNAGGSMLVYSDGRVTGLMSFDNDAFVSVYEGGIVDFDLAQGDAGATALVNDLSIIQGTPIYTLTVDGSLKPGSYVYALADGAAEFTGTISVVNKKGKMFGEFTVGETVKVGYDDYTLNLTDGALSVMVESPDLTPQAPVGTAEKVSWETNTAEEYVVEYSTDNFEHVIRVVTTGNGIDTPDLPGGTYQWRVKADDNSEWAVGDAIVSEPEPDPAPKVVQAVEDGNDDLFFATTNGAWSNIYYAMHVGSINDNWSGTREIVSADGRGRIQNLFFGSADPNVLCLTDNENGDAIFVDDAYTGLPEDVEKNTARLYRIQEIRAGAGDDIVDMTSQRCEYTGNGLAIRGGDGDDTIWANKGDNFLFGDAGNDRIVGASGNDVIAGGIGNDSMHGGGGDDMFAFCDNWGSDTVEQLETGTVTLWFASGDESNWNAETLTYSDGENSVTVSGVAADKITLKFGSGNTPEDAAQFASLFGIGAFDAFTSRRVFEDKGLLT